VALAVRPAVMVKRSSGPDDHQLLSLDGDLIGRLTVRAEVRGGDPARAECAVETAVGIVARHGEVGASRAGAGTDDDKLFLVVVVTREEAREDRPTHAEGCVEISRGKQRAVLESLDGPGSGAPPMAVRPTSGPGARRQGAKQSSESHLGDSQG